MNRWAKEQKSKGKEMKIEIGRVRMEYGKDGQS